MYEINCGTSAGLLSIFLDGSGQAGWYFFGVLLVLANYCVDIITS